MNGAMQRADAELARAGRIPRQPTRIRFFEVLPVLGLVVSLVACNNVEVKRATPTATATTMLRLYEAKDKSNKWNDVVDPAFGRLQARAGSCTRENVLAARCGMEIVQYQEDLMRGRRGLSKECAGLPPVKDCSCGPEGQRAAASAKPFAESDLHRRLSALGLTTKNCEVSDASTDLAREDVEKLLPRLDELACDDVTREDKFAVATLACATNAGGTALRVKLLFRNNPGKGWLFFAMDSKSDALLTLTAEPSSASATASAGGGASASPR